MRLKNALTAAGIAVTNCAKPSFLQSMAHASFTWRWQNAPRRVKAISVQQLLTTQTLTTVLMGPQASGDTKTSDLTALSSLVGAHQPLRIFEFGTFRGQATLTLLINAPQKAHIFTLDLPPEARKAISAPEWDKSIPDSMVGELFRGTPFEPRITQLLSDSRAFDTAPYRDSMDLIFIDGCHDKEFVLSDSKKAFEMVAPNGVIAWHDYSPAFPDVVDYLEELAKSRPVYWIDSSEVAFVIVDEQTEPRDSNGHKVMAIP